MTNSIKSAIRNTLVQISDGFGFDVQEFVGMRFEAILNDADRVGGWTVYWGMFNESDLDHVIAPADVQ